VTKSDGSLTTAQGVTGFLLGRIIAETKFTRCAYDRILNGPVPASF
jgi:hypothetical protein